MWTFHTPSWNNPDGSGIAPPTLAQKVWDRVEELQEWVSLAETQERMNQEAVALWEQWFGNTDPSVNCYKSAAKLWEVVRWLWWTPRRCLLYVMDPQSGKADPADHVALVTEMGGELFVIDPFLKNTTFTQIPSIGWAPVVVVFDAGEAEGSGSNSHETTYTRLNANRVKIERRNAQNTNVFQTRILDLTPRDDFDSPAYNYYDQRAIKYERILRDRNGERFFLQFRVDPDATNENFPIKITLGKNVYVQGQLEQAQSELKQRLGDEEGGSLYNMILSARGQFITNRKKIQPPTDIEVQPFLLRDSE